MTKFVPYLADEMIEDDAALLLAEYAHARGIVIAPPIPIEDIIEKHLKIGIEFDDTHRLFGVPRLSHGSEPDILGAIFFDQRRIVIDESLDQALDRLEGLVVDGLKHGFFDYSIACEIANGGKRQLVIRAGKSHKFTIPEDEVPR